MSELKLPANVSAIAEIIRTEGIKFDPTLRVAKLDAETFNKTLASASIERDQYEKVIGHVVNTLGALSLVHGETSLEACKKDNTLEWTSTEFDLGAGVTLDAQYTRQREHLNTQTNQKEPHYGALVSGVRIEGISNKKGLLGDIRRHIKSASKEAFGS